MNRATHRRPARDFLRTSPRRGSFGLAALVCAAVASCGGPQDVGERPVAYNSLPARPRPAPPRQPPPETPPPVRETPDAPFRAQAPAPEPTPPFTPPRIEEFRLANGIRVLLVQRRDLPIVSVRYVSRRGGDDAPVNRAGLASMVGYLLEQGTATRNAIELSDAFAALGAEHGTWVGWDSGGASVKVLATNLQPALELLADVVQHPAFATEELERARARRLAGLRQERDSPGVIAGNVAARVVYGDAHPYGRSMSGNEAAVTAMTRADVQAFYRAHFVPADSAIVVAGDVTRATLEPLLARSFGTWRAAAPAARPPRAATTPRTQPRIFLVERPAGAPQSMVSIAQVGVPRNSRDYVALSVMNTILGGMFSSRINLNLREAHAYTYGARSGFAFRRGAGPFSAGGAIAVDHTGDAVREFFNELNRIRTSDVTDAELAAARATLTDSLPARFETVDQTANAVSDLHTYGLPLDEYATLAARINAVTAADVRRVAERYLDPTNARIVVVGDRERVEPQLRALNLGPIEVRDPMGERPGAAATTGAAATSGAATSGAATSGAATGGAATGAGAGATAQPARR